MRYIQNPNVVARTIAGEDILVPLNEPSRRIFTLSQTGRALWDRLSEPAEVEELEKLLVTKFNGPPAVVHADVGKFLDAMFEFNLVQPA